MRRRLVAVLLLGVLGVVSMGWFSEFQRRVVFPGPEGVTEPLLHRFATEVGAHELAMRTEDGETIYGWHRAGLGEGPRRVLLYFHGNASSVLGQLPLQGRLNAEGWDYVGIHYRGYPGSTGVPSEAGTRSDARAAWSFVTRELGVPASRVAIHGRSLGGGVAAQLASEVKPGAVVLESTFTSVPDLAREQFGVLPVGRLLKHRFVTRELVGTWDSPTLVAHGSADSIIPVSHGRQLAELFPATTYIEAPGVDHNDALFEGEYADRYVAFLDNAIPAEAR
ncbi:MAG: alpha/beta hydrolase [Myxococcota bacterium]